MCPHQKLHRGAGCNLGDGGGFRGALRCVPHLCRSLVVCCLTAAIPSLDSWLAQVKGATCVQSFAPTGCNRRIDRRWYPRRRSASSRKYIRPRARGPTLAHPHGTHRRNSDRSEPEAVVPGHKKPRRPSWVGALDGRSPCVFMCVAIQQP